MVITLSPAHAHLCPRHQLWTRRHRQTRRALDTARKIVEDRSASGMPIDLGKEWTDRLDRVEALAVSKKISAEDRSHLAAFPEIVVLTHLILDPPTAAFDPKELYLATTAELSRRFARIYTTLGTQDPLYRRFCLYRERDFREAPGQVRLVDDTEITIKLTPDEALVLSDWLERVQMTDFSRLVGVRRAAAPPTRPPHPTDSSRSPVAP